MSDGIHIPRGTAGEKPGRTLRNLGEPWEPLRPGTGLGTSPDRLRGPPRACTDPLRDVYVPRRRGSCPGVDTRDDGEAAAGEGGRGAGRGIWRKSPGMYAVITDFSLQLQRSEKPGTELGKPWGGPAPAPVP